MVLRRQSIGYQTHGNQSYHSMFLPPNEMEQNPIWNLNVSSTRNLDPEGVQGPRIKDLRHTYSAYGNGSSLYTVRAQTIKRKHTYVCGFRYPTEKQSEPKCVQEKHLKFFCFVRMIFYIFIFTSTAIVRLGL